MLWEPKTRDTVETENTGSCCDTELVMGFNAALTIFGICRECQMQASVRDRARRLSIRLLLWDVR